MSERPPTLFDRMLAFGTEGYPPVVARRLLQVNDFNALVAVFHVAFAVMFAVFDWSALKVMVGANLTVALLFVATPFWHRVNDVAGMVYVALVNGVATFAFAHIIGSAAGLQYFLFAAPGAVVFFGPRWIRLAACITALFAAAFCYIELALPPYTQIAPISPALAAGIKVASIFGVMSMVFLFVFLVLRQVEEAEASLTVEYDRSEGLLHNLMPDSIARRLKDEPEAIIADHFDEVTILFADIVDFTPRAGRLAPDELIRFLNRVFSAFDDLAQRHGLEKIKTIGDAYMVAGGLPQRRDGHAVAVGEMALDMLAATRRLAAETGDDLTVRVGIHTGPAVAGVIGTRKLFYDVWGDTVNTASRMESQGSAGRIQITDEARRALGDGFVFEPRGPISVKGKGRMKLFYLTGRA